VDERVNIVVKGDPTRTLEHYTSTYFDGMGRIHNVSTTGPDGKYIATITEYDPLIPGRVLRKSNPHYGGIDTPYDTAFTYDGLSRIIDTLTPDNYHITTTHQGLKKVVTDQRNHPTAYTYDIHQRLKKVEDPYGTVTEYNYDPLE
jgi:YD repeat-containing protein